MYRRLYKYIRSFKVIFNNIIEKILHNNVGKCNRGTKTLDLNNKRENKIIVIKMTSITPKKYNLINLPKKYRNLFPGYKVPFYFKTDIGLIECKCTSASEGTEYGDPIGGNYITSIERNALKKWYEKHMYIKKGDNFLIKIIKHHKLYQLKIKRSANE